MRYAINMFIALLICVQPAVSQSNQDFFEKRKEFVSCPDAMGCHLIQFVPGSDLIKELLDKGYQAGGYSWQGLVLGLAASRNIKLELYLNAEGEVFYATSNNWDAILQTEQLIKELVGSQELRNFAAEKATELFIME